MLKRLTFVVDVGGNVNNAGVDVDRDVVEMFVRRAHEIRQQALRLRIRYLKQPEFKCDSFK